MSLRRVLAAVLMLSDAERRVLESEVARRLRDDSSTWLSPTGERADDS
jgi:hypothetical protein